MPFFFRRCFYVFLLAVSSCVFRCRSNDSGLFSTVHCVGENFDSTTVWKYQSCAFTQLCWEDTSRTFWYSPSPTEIVLQKQWERNVRLLSSSPSSSLEGNLFRISTIAWDPVTTTKQVSLGSIMEDTEHSQQKPWFPNIASAASTPPTSATEDTVVFPVLWTTPTTERSLWKDLFAMYTVLAMFDQLSQKNVLIVSMNDHVVKGVKEEWVSVLRRAALFQPQESVDPNTLHCASHGVAGLGSIMGSSGTHVIFRGIGLYDFGVYALQNLGFQHDNEQPRRGVSVVAVWDKNNDNDQQHQRNTLMATSLRELVSSYNDPLVSFRDDVAQSMATLKGVAQQVTSLSSASQTTLWCVRSTHPLLFPIATFLPRDALLIVVDDDDSMSVSERDFLQSFTHFRLHWIRHDDESALSALVKTRVDRILLLLQEQLL